jgi:hypothetical protein
METFSSCSFRSSCSLNSIILHVMTSRKLQSNLHLPDLHLGWIDTLKVKTIYWLINIQTYIHIK